MKSSTCGVIATVLLLLLAGACTKHSIDHDLINAAGLGNISDMKRLLALGANVNAKDTTLDQWTPLMWAVYEDQESAVGLLLEAGADPNAKDATGKTALSYASPQNQKSIIRLLVLAGAQTKDASTEVELETNYPGSSLEASTKTTNESQGLRLAQPLQEHQK